MEVQAWKRFLAIFVAITLLIGLVPVSAFAAQGGNQGDSGNQGSGGNNSYKVYFHVAKPGMTPSSSSAYAPYNVNGGMSGEVRTTSKNIPELRNRSPETEITQYIANWPTGYTAETFKEFDQFTANKYGWRQTYDGDEYTITWISIVPISGNGYKTCSSGCNTKDDHVHVDGTLTKKVKVKDELKLFTTIEEKQFSSEKLEFKLEALLRDEDENPLNKVDDTIAPIELSADIEAGKTTAPITVPDKELTYGYYKVSTVNETKWDAQNDIYIFVHSDGTIEYSYTLGNFTSISQPTITNKYKAYTVIYDDGLSGNAFDRQKYTGLRYGDATPAFSGTPTYIDSTKVFGGWSPTVTGTVSKDITYSATWNNNAYTVIWKDSNGDVLETDENVVNGTKAEYNGIGEKSVEKLAEAKSDVQYKFTFAGWTPAITEVNGTDQVYTATYHTNIKTYTVKWVDSDGTTILETDANVPYGSTPSYDGQSGSVEKLASDKSDDQYLYKFAGWTPTSNTVTGDITYKATYSQTVKQYAVIWKNYDGTTLDMDSVAYGTTPSYTGSTPTRPNSSNFIYEFAGWEPVITAVTGPATYTAKYNSTQIGFEVAVNIKLDGLHENITDILSGSAGLELRSVNSPIVEYPLTWKAEGVYTNTAVLNGTYKVYLDNDTEPVCDQSIIVEDDDVEKTCNYYSVSYDTNGGSSGPVQTYYHEGATVYAASETPTKDECVFVGWRTNNTPAKEVKASEKITESIVAPTILTAVWEDTIDIKVNVHMDHTTENSGYDNNGTTKDEVRIELLERTSSTSPWKEVKNTALDINQDSSTHIYTTTPAGEPEASVLHTTYAAKGYTYNNIPSDGREFSITAVKKGYVLDTTDPAIPSGIKVTPDGNNLIIDVYLKFDVNSFDLDFEVEMDPSVTNKEAYPDAVIAKVAFWDTDVEPDNWEIITQHRGSNAGVKIDIDSNTGRGAAFYPVWKFDEHGDPYYYKLIVTALIDDDVIYPITSPLPEAEIYKNDYYTVDISSSTSDVSKNGVDGAYFVNDTQVGTLKGIIDIGLYDVTFNPGANATVKGSPTYTESDLYKLPNLSSYTPVSKKAGYIFEGWYLDSGCTERAESGKRITADTTLYANWIDPFKVTGAITIDGTYELSGDTKIIHDADRISNVTVLLEQALSGSEHFVLRDSKKVSVTYPSAKDSPAVVNYEFENVESQGTWRVRILGHNYEVKYKNESSSDFGSANDTLTSPSIAVDSPVNGIANVDAVLNFKPDNFDLKFRVDASNIADAYRPDSARVYVLYDDDILNAGDPINWPVISQMQDGSGYTGKTVTVGTDDSYSVWKNHPSGHLYDYAVKLQDVKKGDQIINDSLYTVEYNGSAFYKSPGAGGTDQSQMLTLTLKPMEYPITYYLESGSDIKISGMTVSKHTWSKDTNLKASSGWIDKPTRNNMVFAGWVDEHGNAIDTIPANTTSEVKLYATWKTDIWSTSGSITSGDGTPDEQQVLFMYGTDGQGSVNRELEVITITGSDFTDETVSATAASVATGISGQTAFDRWEYIGNNTDENDTAKLNISGSSITPVILNADGGKSYTFKAHFAEDTSGISDNSDGIPDKYQAFVEFVSTNSSQGTVTGKIKQVVTFGSAGSYIQGGTIVPSLTDVLTNAKGGFAFDYWTEGASSQKLTKDTIEVSRTVTGGTTITFYAHFAKDTWDAAGNKDTEGDNIPDNRQVLFKYISSSNHLGTVSGDTIQVFTLDNDPATPDNVEPVNVTTSPESGYTFDYWGDLNGFHGTPGGRLSDDTPFGSHTITSGGQTITYVAHFAEDKWVDGATDSKTGGDGKPDNIQILIEYSSADDSKGTVNNELEVVTLSNSDPYTATGSIASAKAGYAFDVWTDESINNNVEYTATAKTITPVITSPKGGSSYKFVASFDKDELGGEGSNGDDVPDKYQKTVTFKISNGNWTTKVEGNKWVNPVTPPVTNADNQTVYITLKENGKNSIYGTAYLASNQIPSNGMMVATGSGGGSGYWDINPDVNQPITDNVIYTFTYDDQLLPVKYLNAALGTDTLNNLTGSEAHVLKNHYIKVVPDVEEDVVGNGFTLGGTKYNTTQYIQVIDTIDLGTPVREGFAFTGWQTSLGGTPESGSGTIDMTFRAQWEKDTWSASTNSLNESDGIPDKYQVAIRYTSDVGGSVGPNEVRVITVTNAGKWQSSGTITDATGSEASAETGNVFSKWVASSSKIKSDNATDNPVTGVVTITNATGGSVYTLESNFDSDTLGPDGNPDGIPDKYQKKVTFKVVNGTWSDDTTDDIVQYLELKTSDVTDESGSASLTTPAGMKAKPGYTGGAWDVEPPATVYGNDAVTYTYTFNVIPSYPSDSPTKPNNNKPGSSQASRIPDMLNGVNHFAYITGYENGTVRPNANITRAEVATIFYRLLKEEVREANMTTENNFTDVNEGHWYNTAVSTMTRIGIIEGRGQGIFDPNAPITRAEFATIAARFTDIITSEDVDFNDIDNHWAEKYILSAAAYGWVTGYEDDSFRPNNYITRAEAITLINRVVCRMPETVHDLHDEMIVFTDNANPDAWFYLAIQEAANSHDYDYKDDYYESWVDPSADTDKSAN